MTQSKKQRQMASVWPGRDFPPPAYDTNSRDWQLAVHFVEEGWTGGQLSTHYGISRVRVWQVIDAVHTACWKSRQRYLDHRADPANVSHPAWLRGAKKPDPITPRQRTMLIMGGHIHPNWLNPIFWKGVGQ